MDSGQEAWRLQFFWKNGDYLTRYGLSNGLIFFFLATTQNNKLVSAECWIISQIIRIKRIQVDCTLQNIIHVQIKNVPFCQSNWKLKVQNLWNSYTYLCDVQSPFAQKTLNLNEFYIHVHLIIIIIFIAREPHYKWPKPTHIAGCCETSLHSKR